MIVLAHTMSDEASNIALAGENIANTFAVDQLHPDLPPVSDDARPKKLRRIYARSLHPAFPARG